MKVIGIDPGTIATGYAFLSLEDSPANICGTIRPKKGSSHARIFEICKNLEQLIEANKPDLAALEKVFYQKNIQSVLRTSELRGAIIMTLINSKIKIIEYTPAQIKLTTTGNGRASKAQVRFFIERIVPQNSKNASSDAIDALAIAYTAARKTKFQ